MSLSEIPMTTPAVDKSTLKDFLTQVATYIRENPIVVHDPEKQSADLINNKPHMYVPCQARASSVCPDQNSRLPRCHKCLNAKAAAKTLEEIGPSLGFKVDSAEEYPGLGALLQTICHERSGSTMAFEIDGDYEGIATIFVNMARRPATKKK